MSFLNPVNLPVLRFSSTDADAPQINYNSRTAGDVKAVLKACLVDGYGTTASAGWSAVNEVGEVAEFVSPSASMSDYRLGINDSSASKTDWYYRYQNVRTNPNYNSPQKSILYIDRSSADNKWDLLVTERGVVFVESFLYTSAQKTVSRMVWLGQVKSALVSDIGINMSFFCAGYQAQVGQPAQNFEHGTSVFRHYQLAGLSQVDFNAANIQSFVTPRVYGSVSAIDTASEVFLSRSGDIVAQQPGWLLQTVADNNSALSTDDAVVSGRPVLSVSLGVANSNTTIMQSYAKRIALYLDYWEY